MRDLMGLGLRRYGSRPFPAFSDADITEFEKAFSSPLPSDYVQFLRVANGGTLDLCEYTDAMTLACGSINDFYGLGSRRKDEATAADGKWDIGNLWGETRVFRALLFGGIGVPIARDGGDNRLFLDFCVSPPVVKRLIVATRSTYNLAQNFAELVDMLHAPVRKMRCSDGKPHKTRW